MKTLKKKVRKLPRRRKPLNEVAVRRSPEPTAAEWGSWMKASGFRPNA